MIHCKTVQKQTLMVFSNKVQEMAKQCRSYNVKNVFISGIVYTESVHVKTLENIHDKMVNLCS